MISDLKILFSQSYIASLLSYIFFQDVTFAKETYYDNGS